MQLRSTDCFFFSFVAGGGQRGEAPAAEPSALGEVGQRGAQAWGGDGGG